MNDYYKIKLYGKNTDSSHYAIVSLNKIDQVDIYKWYLGKDGYPFTYINGGRCPLHRFIWCINSGSWSTNKFIIKEKNISQIKYYVDHINRDKLNATDNNLRLATPAQNSYNKTSKSDMIDPETNEQIHHIKFKKSGYEVTITKDGITNKINKIATLEEAKEIYNMMALEMFDQFAVLYKLI